jgi:membrane protein
VRIPGLAGATLYDIVKFFFRELGSLKLTERAAMITYNFLMAMPPIFLIIFSLVPHLPIKNVQNTILNTLKIITPNQQIYRNVSGIFLDFINTQRNDVLSYGIVLVFFFASNGVIGLLRSFDRNSLYKPRTGIMRRWAAIKLTGLLIAVSILTLVVLIIQTQELNKLVLRLFHTLVAVKILSLVILACLVFVVISIIYTYGPSLTHRVRFVSPGSVFATVMGMIVTAVFFFLVNHFIHYDKIYGTIGTLIAFLVWIWLNVVIILLGFELNISILLGLLSQRNDVEK